MCIITLIATGHRENGLCNSNELFKIIEAVDPDVIFEEVPPNIFLAVYEGKTTDSLETATIKRYMQAHSIRHCPVDMNMDDLSSKHIRSEIGKVFDVIAYYSPEYSNLLEKQQVHAGQLGFPYLNSDECSTLLSRATSLEEQIIRDINDSSLSQIYNVWQSFLDNRRNTMLTNIYRYSDANKFERALFMVGAEHKKPLMDKLSKFENVPTQKIKWVFDYL